MTIGEVGLELLKGADANRLNALSMASSGIHNASEIHMLVSVDLLCSLAMHLIVHYLALFLTTIDRSLRAPLVGSMQR